MTWDETTGRDLPQDWPAIRQRVKDRAGGRCQWVLPSGSRCPRPGTDADHKGDKDDHSMRNLRWLCKHHHGKRTAIQGFMARRAKKKPRRAPEDHPNR